MANFKVTDEMRAEMKRLQEMGTPVQEIAKQFKISRETAYKHIFPAYKERRRQAKKRLKELKKKDNK